MFISQFQAMTVSNLTIKRKWRREKWRQWTCTWKALAILARSMFVQYLKLKRYRLSKCHNNTQFVPKVRDVSSYCRCSTNIAFYIQSYSLFYGCTIIGIYAEYVFSYYLYVEVVVIVTGRNIRKILIIIGIRFLL